MKKCTKCKEIKDLREFSKCKAFKDGLQYNCKVCTRVYREENRERLKELNKEYRVNNSEKISLSQRRYYIENRQDIIARTKKWQRKYPDKANTKTRKWAKENKDKIKEKNRKYDAKNKGKRNSWTTKRRATKLNATPLWADLDKIKIVYEKAKWLESITGLKYDVDHIVPLQGKDVCGLHVWDNLQILEQSLNRSKSNKLEVDLSIDESI